MQRLYYRGYLEPSSRFLAKFDYLYLVPADGTRTVPSVSGGKFVHFAE